MIGSFAKAACAVGLCLSALADLSPARAQSGVNIQINGPGNANAYVDMTAVGGNMGYYEFATSPKGSVSATTSQPLTSGIYEFWVESGQRTASGTYNGGSTFAYVGSDGRANLNFDLTGRAPVWPSPQALRQIADDSMEWCKRDTWERAFNQLKDYAADVEKSMQDMQGAIQASVKDGLGSIPDAQRGRLLRALATGGAVQDLANQISQMSSEAPQAHKLGDLARAYNRMARLSGQRDEYIENLKEILKKKCRRKRRPMQPLVSPIEVGPKSTVGCDAKLKQDVTNMLGGGGLGALTGGQRSFGLGSGGSSSRNTRTAPSSSSNEPKVSPDPVPAEMKRAFSGLNGTNITFGTMFSDKGFWVSSEIASAPCQGTFQTVYVDDPETGQKAGPTDYVLTGLYSEWKLTVNWTYDRYVNNQHVEHKEGGWQDGGRKILGTWVTPSNGKGVWNDLGFSTAVAGAKGMGFFFPVPYSDFTQRPLDIVIHVANPDSDPVRTTGFAFETMPIQSVPGSFGRAPRQAPKAPSQSTAPEMVWKTAFTVDGDMPELPLPAMTPPLPPMPMPMPPPPP